MIDAPQEAPRVRHVGAPLTAGEEDPMAEVWPPAVEALERRLGIPEGSLSPEERTRALEALHDAATLVLAEVPAGKRDAWRAAPPDIAVLIVLKAARREFDNPSGHTSVQMGSMMTVLGSTSGVYLTEAEVAAIRREATGHRGRGFTGSVTLPSGTEPSEYPGWLP